MMDENLKIPDHVAIILDGNGRWAKKRGMPRNYGHTQGAKTVEVICEEAYRMGISYLTVYAFSTENWNRPKAEVQALMALLVTAIHRETPDLMKNNVRLHAIGDLLRLDEDVRKTLNDCIEQTSVNTGTTLILALSYSSRWELLNASKLLAKDICEKRISPDDITEDSFSQYLTTKGIPDPDLLIRTGGEKRISNFLLWQLSYAELYFTNVYWPDFRENELYEAILYYQQRERRFGKTSEQLK